MGLTCLKEYKLSCWREDQQMEVTFPKKSFPCYMGFQLPVPALAADKVFRLRGSGRLLWNLSETDW